MSARGGRSCARRRGGFSYAEVLVATLLVALSLVPAVRALQTGIQGGEVHESLAVTQRHLMSKMEEVLAHSFANLAAEEVAAGGAPSAYSDGAGAPERRLVLLSRYDGDNADGDDDPFTGKDAGLLWVRVEIEATEHVLETLTGR